MELPNILTFDWHLIFCWHNFILCWSDTLIAHTPLIKLYEKKYIIKALWKTENFKIQAPQTITILIKIMLFPF